MIVAEKMDKTEAIMSGKPSQTRRNTVCFLSYAESRFKIMYVCDEPRKGILEGKSEVLRHG